MGQSTSKPDTVVIVDEPETQNNDSDTTTTPTPTTTTTTTPGCPPCPGCNCDCPPQKDCNCPVKTHCTVWQAVFGVASCLLIICSMIVVYFMSKGCKSSNK